MGIISVFNGSFSDLLADQWSDVITADIFDEKDFVKPGIGKKRTKNKAWTNNGSFTGVISKDSIIYVPENTAAIVYNQSAIENIIYQPGGYVFTEGDGTIFAPNESGSSLFGQFKERFKYAGTPANERRVSFINLREVRGIKFGTRGPLTYHDKFYDTDMEIYAYGTFSVMITDPVNFVKKFLPANMRSYNANQERVRDTLIPELLQSVCNAINSMSEEYRISQLPSQNIKMAQIIETDGYNAGSWEERFGFKIVKIAIENIEFSEESRELVNMFSEKKLSVMAYENVSQKAANISAQQKIAQGIEDNGFGESGMGMLVGMNMAPNVSQTITGTNTNKMTIDEQIENLKKLKELVDCGILTEEEFDQKKKEIMMM